MARITIGNVKVAGFVNLVADNRVVIGTGSYTDKSGNKVFKESITVFFEDKYDGHRPAKGEYVEVRGDLVISPRRDQPEVLNGAMNLRFANQLSQQEVPQRREAAEAGHDDI